MSEGTFIGLREALDLPAKEARSLYAKHVNAGLLDIYRLLGLDTLDVAHAQGVKLVLTDGREILDFTSALGILALGHNHPRVIEAEQLCHQRLAVDALKLGPMALQAVLAANVASLLPAPLAVCFFALTGADAVDAAMKLCERVQGPQRSYYLACSGSFHGRTHRTLPFTRSAGFDDGFLPGLASDRIIEVPFDSLPDLQRTVRARGSECIAMVVEPIQGQAVATPSANYLQGVVELCHQHGILVVFDEIKVGMGRTGTFCAFQRQQAVPDVVTLSKALGGGKRAISAMVTSAELFGKAYGDRSSCALHGTTFGGLGESCAVAIQTLDVLIRDDLMGNAAKRGKYLAQRLGALQQRRPAEVDEVRGVGLFQGVRFRFGGKALHSALVAVNPALAHLKDSIMIAAFVRELFERHQVLAHFSGTDPDVLHVMPPLCVDDADIDRFVDALEAVVATGFIRVATRFATANLRNLL